MAKYLHSGSRIRVSRDVDIDVRDRLSPNTYTVNFDERENTFFLSQIDDLEAPAKIYGDVEERARRIIDTFNDRSGNTGVLLTGDKGSGKSMLARMVSRISNLPTLIITQPFVGEQFNTFMQTISQEVIVVLDEFEKVYDLEKQERVLTILDGMYESKKLFIITANNANRLDRNMINRPGRIYYRYDYYGLSVESIKETCSDMLKPAYQGLTDKILSASLLISDFNFDMLKAVIEEINRYGDPLEDTLNRLNVRVTSYASHDYQVTVTSKDGTVLVKYDRWAENPMAIDGVFVYPEKGPARPARPAWEIELHEADPVEVPKYYAFFMDDLLEVDHANRTITYETDAGVKAVFKEIPHMRETPKWSIL